MRTAFSLTASVLCVVACHPVSPPVVVGSATVLAGDRRLAEAVVVIRCSEPNHYALRTDVAGNVRIRLRASVVRDTCVLLAAKQGYRTAQTGRVHLCDASSRSCAPITLQIVPLP